MMTLSSTVLPPATAGQACAGIQQHPPVSTRPSIPLGDNDHQHRSRPSPPRHHTHLDHHPVLVSHHHHHRNHHNNNHNNNNHNNNNNNNHNNNNNNNHHSSSTSNSFLHWVRAVLSTCVVVAWLQVAVSWYAFPQRRSTPLVLGVGEPAMSLSSSSLVSMMTIRPASRTDPPEATSWFGSSSWREAPQPLLPTLALGSSHPPHSRLSYSSRPEEDALHESITSTMSLDSLKPVADDWRMIPEQPVPTMSMMNLARALGNGINPSKNVGSSRPLTVAVCHKSLFGTLDLSLVAKWAAYYRVLGVDHVYIWYIPSLSSRPGFKYLSQLPFVTMIPNKKGRVMTYPDGYTRIERFAGGDQRDDERQCLRRVAWRYDWVLLADADEYLWWDHTRSVRHPYTDAHAMDYLHRRPGDWPKPASAMDPAPDGLAEPIYDVKDFLALYHNYSYLSFGKWMYSAKHTIARNDSVFILDQYPFTAKSYCKKSAPLRGSPWCPQWKGRCKLLVRPSVHVRINIHGVTEQMDNVTGALQFHTSVAHMKEWPALFKKQNKTFYHLQDPAKDRSSHAVEMDTIRRQGLLLTAEETGLHEVNASFVPEDAERGLYRLHYDQDRLDNWIRGLMNYKINRYVGPEIPA